jgi:hypothetical protein
MYATLLLISSIIFSVITFTESMAAFLSRSVQFISDIPMNIMTRKPNHFLLSEQVFSSGVPSTAESASG